MKHEFEEKKYKIYKDFSDNEVSLRKAEMDLKRELDGIFSRKVSGQKAITTATDTEERSYDLNSKTSSK